MLIVLKDGNREKDEEQAGSESKRCSYHLICGIKELSHFSSLHLQVLLYHHIVGENFFPT